MVAVGMTGALIAGGVHILVLQRALRRFAPTLHWSEMEIVEGARAGLAIVAGSVPAPLAGRCDVVLTAVWGGRSFSAVWAIDSDLRGRPPDTMARGVYAPTLCRVRANDFLDLFEASRPIVDPGPLYVVPRSDPWSDTVGEARTGGAAMEAYLVRDRNDTLIEQRPYVPGDNVRHLAWNVYAHTGELYVRIGEETPPPASTVRIVVETVPRSAGMALEPLDRLCRTVRGMVEALVSSGCSVICTTSAGGTINGAAGSATARDLAALSWGHVHEGRGTTAGDTASLSVAVDSDGRVRVTRGR